MDKIERRNIWIILLGCGLFLTALFIMLLGSFSFSGKEEVITIGVFSDSYWEVQNGYSYQILEDAIDLFEEENPGVRVE